MAKRKLGIMILALCVCICMITCHVEAASTTDATDPIATGEPCSLRITYSCDGTAISGQSVQLYKVADVSELYQYTLTADFASCGLALNGVQTSGEWDVIRSTLDVHVLVAGIEPLLTAETDGSGAVSFEALTPGLYLTSAVYAEQEDLICTFDSSLIALPGMGADGTWQYQVEVAAKPQILPPLDPDGETEWKVLKLWKGDAGKTDRPQSIEIEIFRNGESYERVTLSEETNWSYSWLAEDDAAEWKVVERNVPAGYVMTVAERETTFTVTNTYQPDDPKPPTPPKTGDTSNMLLYTALLYVSGSMLILLGAAGKRKRNEETN